MLGAFASFLVVVQWQWAYWLAYLLIPPAIGLVAAAIEFILLRRLRRADMFTIVIATVFLGIALDEAFRLTYNTELLAVPEVFAASAVSSGAMSTSQRTRSGLSPARSSPRSAACWCFATARSGVACARWRQTSAAPSSAATRSIRSICWPGSSAAPSPVLPAFSSRRSRASRSNLSIQIITAGFVAGVIGGFDSPRGAIIGGLLLGVAESLSAAYISSAMKNCVSFLLLFVVLMWRPDGLFPEKASRRV